MRNWTPAVPIAAALGFSALVFERLPAEVSPSLGALFPASIPDSGDSFPRSAAALLLPVTALLVWALLAGLSRIAAPRPPFPEWLANEATDAHAIARFASTYNTIIFSIVACIAMLHITALGTVIGWPAWTLQVFTAAIGLLMVTVGNVMPRARPNWIVGIRTKGTLASAEVWMRTHRLLGAMLMVVGVLVMIASVFAPQYALVIAAVGGLASLVAAHALGMRRGPGTQSAVVVTALLAATLAPHTAAGQDSVARVDTVVPGHAVEHEAAIRTADMVLPATLTLPRETRGPVPVVVMVAGSGPTDRNGNGPLTQTNLYAQIAWELARSGIASLRYDKRGIGESSRTLDHSSFVIDDFVNDVTLGVSMVRTDPRFSRVYMLGHSEGAMHVLLAANRGANVDGVIMMSGTGRRLSQVLHDQFKLHVDSAMLAQIDGAWTKFVRGEDPGEIPPIAQSVFVIGRGDR